MRLAALRLRPFAVLVAACLTAGCGQAVLYNDLMERDSNEMMAVLIRAGVSCEKVKGEENRWQITVAHADFAKAVDELKKYGLPRDRFVNIGEVFKKSGLVSSPTEERVRFMHAVSQELSDTISQIDGVVSARVHLVLPNANSFGEQTRASSASVFIRHRPNARLEGSIPDVNRLVMNAVEGLKYENVTTILTPAEDPPAAVAAPVDTVKVMSMQVGSNSLPQFWTLLGGMAALSVVSLGALALVLLRRKPAMTPTLVRP